MPKKKYPKITKKDLEEGVKKWKEENEWEEFEGSLSNFGSYEGGLYFSDGKRTYIEDLFGIYLGVVDESYPHNINYDAPKIKIKARKGEIIIKRLEE